MVYVCVGTLSLQCSHKFVCSDNHQEKLPLAIENRSDLPW